MKRVHPDGVTARLNLATPTRRLEHTELRLQLRNVPAKRLECLVDLLFFEAAI
jgi:hypothetical protein